MIQDDHDKHTRILTKGEGGKLDNRRVSIVLTEYFPASLYYGLPDGEERFKERVKQIFEELHLGSPFQADLGDVMGGTYIQDRKSTRLNSSHVAISYAVFCLKKKNV